MIKGPVQGLESGEVMPVHEKSRTEMRRWRRKSGPWEHKDHGVGRGAHGVYTKYNATQRHREAILPDTVVRDSACVEPVVISLVLVTTCPRSIRYLWDIAGLCAMSHGRFAYVIVRACHRDWRCLRHFAKPK